MSLPVKPRVIVWWVLAGTILGRALPLTAQQTAPPLRVTLQDALDMALERGHAARAAQAARDAARSRTDAFRAGLLPQLSLEGNVPSFNRSIIQVVQPDGGTLFRSQNQTSTALRATVSQILPLTGGSLVVSSSLARLSVSGAQDALNWSSTPVTIGIRQPILRPNAVGWDKREQPVRSLVMEREYLEAREEIALRTTSMFFDVYAAQVELETASSNAAVNDTLYTLNTGRYEIGSIGENDLLQSELALLRAQTALDAAVLDLERTQAALRLALNESPTTPLVIVVPEHVPEFEPDTARAVSAALENRSALSQLDLQDVQARRAIAEAKLNGGFGATLWASYGFNATGPSFDGAYTDLLEAQQVNLFVEVPLLQWGGTGARVRAAELERDELASIRRTTLEQTAHEARFAALHLAQARRGLLLSAKSDTVGERRFEVAYNRYVIGRISIDNLFQAQREKDQAKEQYVRALRGYWEAYYQLRLVTLYDFERGQQIR